MYNYEHAWTSEAPHIGHRGHLCEIIETGELTLEQINTLVGDAKFICRLCGRVAAKEENLCEPRAR
jgi:hypothetical protein